MEIIVSYEEASKNGDMSALTCFKSKNKYAFDMVVGAVEDEADEIFKIVSEQGYLKEHDSELLDKVMQKQRTIIDDDGVMYRVVFLKDIEDLKKEVSK